MLPHEFLRVAIYFHNNQKPIGCIKSLAQLYTYSSGLLNF